MTNKLDAYQVRSILTDAYASTRFAEGVSVITPLPSDILVEMIAQRIALLLYPAPQQNSDRIGFVDVVRGRAAARRIPKRIVIGPTTVDGLDAEERLETYNDFGSADIIVAVHCKTLVCSMEVRHLGNSRRQFFGQIGTQDETRDYIEAGLPTIDRQRNTAHPKGWGQPTLPFDHVRKILWTRLLNSR